MKAIKLLMSLMIVTGSLQLKAQTTTATTLTPYPWDILTYDNKQLPNYGLQWSTDSWYNVAPSAWLSGYGGIKFFANGAPRMSIHPSGNIGIGTTDPRAFLDVGNPTSNTLTSVLGRLPEGNSTLNGTYLGVNTYGTQPWNNCKSFALEHRFYGTLNNAINFYRGSGETGGYIAFATNDGSEKMIIDLNGYVGIGTSTPTEKLSVNGNIRSRKVIVTQTGWPDYVFESTYQLPSLDSVHNFIKENKHLPGMASAAVVEKEGLDLGEIVKQQQQKIEELMLYMIEMKKENDQTKKENNEMKEVSKLILEQNALLLQKIKGLEKANHQNNKN